jgi:pilus assembly protein Flp/PilA
MLDLFTTLWVWVDMKLQAVRDDRGAITIEYGILVVFIALAVVAGVTTFGTQLNAWLGRIAAAVAAVPAAPGG